MSSISSRLQQVGQRYRDFVLVKSVHIPELQCLLRELVHEPSGASIIHIGNDDPENLFCLSFQTLPETSNGVAHILEHTVLCGSKKFPVKDPFFAMTRRSLNTYMNALTGADFTCYPASSQVTKDFYNLLDVYLDAVFHPNLDEVSFLQEGVRLEFANPSDPNSPLEYKGIVYNEMKGSLASASARLAEEINAALFPNVTYGINSGGDPKVIPQLTYEELKAFHHKFYNPSRCLFFFYGNMSLEGHLDFIAENILNKTKKAPLLPPIPLQPRYTEPRYRVLSYPIGAEEDGTHRTMIAFGWLTCHILKQQDALALNILEIILMDTDASPLKMILLKSGLCKQASSFIDMETHEIPWGISLKGCNPENADALESLIKSSLQEISRKGIPLAMVESAIHQLEFYRSEITGDHAPFGLSLFMRSGLLKQHGVDPEQGLHIHALFDEIRQKALADPFYFSQLIKEYLINNPHFVRIVMIPDKELHANEAEAERIALDKIKASLTPEQVQAILRKTKKLENAQKEQEELVEEETNVLPKISIKEVPLSIRDYTLARERVGNLNVFHHNAFTNEIIYADLVFNLPDLPESDIPFLRLLTVILPQVGCGKRTYVENLDYIQSHTGGIWTGVSLNLQAYDHQVFFPTFHVKSKALHRKASKLFPLMHETVRSANLNDFERLKEIIFKHFTAMESRLNQNALKYAVNLSASRLNVASKIANDLYGLEYYWKIREIVNDFDKQGPYAIAKLQQIQEKVLGLDDPHLILTCNGITYDELKGRDFYGIKEMETKPFVPWQGHYLLEDVPSQGRTISSPVAFIAKVFPTVSYVHPDAAALTIAASLFDNLVLHSRIREQGGAYGGGAVSNPLSGNFYFYSYRDPNISKTLQAFQEAIHVVIKGEFDDFDLEEAKLEILQDLDSPVSPGSRGEIAYGWWREGKTPEIRQLFRSKILNLSCKEVQEATKRILAPQFEKGSAAVFASKGLLEEENKTLNPPLCIEGI